MLEVDDADRAVEQAVAAGATIMIRVADMFWGARYGKLKDPYGHEWGINQQVEQLTEAQESEGAKRYFSKE
jgi:PhnB protein